ncbi:MAG: hypothetical protein K2X93_02860 [Candidatus Obscuribacterales bacterium]|nr:hypothetical protein [Candidatus Obscuribacterales bacterium]
MYFEAIFGEQVLCVTKTERLSSGYDWDMQLDSNQSESNKPIASRNRLLFIIFAIAFALYLVIYQMDMRFVGPMSADEQRILEKKRSLEKQYGL